MQGNYIRSTLYVADGLTVTVKTKPINPTDKGVLIIQLDGVEGRSFEIDLEVANQIDDFLNLGE